MEGNRSGVGLEPQGMKTMIDNSEMLLQWVMGIRRFIRRKSSDSLKKELPKWQIDGRLVYSVFVGTVQKSENWT
jgi:hypothetical protein